MARPWQQGVGPELPGTDHESASSSVNNDERQNASAVVVDFLKKQCYKLVLRFVIHLLPML